MIKPTTNPNKTYLFLILGIVLAFIPLASMAAVPSVLKPKPTIIAGKVENFEGISNVLVVHYYSAFNKKELAIDMTKTNGEFHTVADYVFAQNIHMSYDDYYNITPFIEPGDSIFVHIDARKLRANDPQAVTFTGNNPEPSRQIAEWNRHEPEIVNPKFDPTASLEEYYKILDQLYKDRVALIAEYARTHEMSERMQEWAAKDYIINIGSVLPLQALVERNIRWEIGNAPVFNTYDERNFQIANFVFHLNNFGDGGAFDKVEDQPYDDGFMRKIKQVMSFLSENAPEGAVRDMILYIGTSTYIKDYPDTPGIFDRLLPETAKFFSQPVFQDYLGAVVAEIKKIKEEGMNIKGEEMSGISYLNSENQIENLPAIDPIAYLKEKHRGKVIYIDVWATWCGPCIEEMTHDAPELQDYFKDKDVVFVNLCLNSGTGAGNWINAVATYKIGGENYFFDRDATAKFMALYELQGFPSYLLLDKKGIIVTNRASRPSERDEAIKQIEALLIK